jgi:hypothetical protein
VLEICNSRNLVARPHISDFMARACGDLPLYGDFFVGIRQNGVAAARIDHPKAP